MTAQSVAFGLTAKYPLQAARAKAFHRWLRWMGPWDEPRTMDEKRVRHLTFWTQVCKVLDTQGSVARA